MFHFVKLLSPLYGATTKNTAKSLWRMVAPFEKAKGLISNGSGPNYAYPEGDVEAMGEDGPLAWSRRHCEIGTTLRNFAGKTPSHRENPSRLKRPSGTVTFLGSHISRAKTKKAVVCHFQTDGLNSRRQVGISNTLER